MYPLSSDPRALKRAAQALSKIDGAGSLSTCQEAMARAVGYRDLHHALSVSTSPSGTAASIDVDAAVGVIARAATATSLPVGVTLDALLRARFLPGMVDAEHALAIRQGLFARDYAAAGRFDPGGVCRLKAIGHADDRALVLRRSPGSDSLSKAMMDHGIVSCVSHEMRMHRSGSFFIPLRFWMPYGAWTDEDGSTVLFSRDYCPLWRIADGQAPVRDDPNRIVRFTSERWFFNEGTFREASETVSEKGLQILRDHRVISLPRLVEWLPHCLSTGTWITDHKRWPWQFPTTPLIAA